jgi:hypothetical protein
MRDQSVAVERNPFACVVTRFACKPVEFGPIVIKLLCGLPTERASPLFHGHTDSLMLSQGKRLQWAQYALLENGLKVYRHGTSIVPGAIVAGGIRSCLTVLAATTVLARTADGQYMDAGIRLLELTRNMHRLFESSNPPKNGNYWISLCRTQCIGTPDRTGLTATVLHDLRLRNNWCP